MTDTRVEATCEICQTPIVNGAAGWRHIMSMGARGGCGLAFPPALQFVFEEIEPLPAPAAAACDNKGKKMASAPGCHSCG
jgi:hypothetical protein